MASRFVVTYFLNELPVAYFEQMREVIFIDMKPALDLVQRDVAMQVVVNKRHDLIQLLVCIVPEIDRSRISGDELIEMHQQADKRQLDQQIALRQPAPFVRLHLCEIPLQSLRPDQFARHPVEAARLFALEVTQQILLLIAVVQTQLRPEKQQHALIAFLRSKDVWSKMEKKLAVTTPRIQDGMPYTTVDGKYNDRQDADRAWWTNSF